MSNVTCDVCGHTTDERELQSISLQNGMTIWCCQNCKYLYTETELQEIVESREE